MISSFPRRSTVPSRFRCNGSTPSPPNSHAWYDWPAGGMFTPGSWASRLLSLMTTADTGSFWGTGAVVGSAWAPATEVGAATSDAATSTASVVCVWSEAASSSVPPTNRPPTTTPPTKTIAPNRIPAIRISDGRSLRAGSLLTGAPGWAGEGVWRGPVTGPEGRASWPRTVKNILKGVLPVMP